MGGRLGAAVVILAAALAWPGSAAAAGTHVICGNPPITQSIVVGNDLVSCPDDGLVIAADGITIDLNGHRFTGTGGTGDIGIDVGTHDGVTVENGTIEGFQIGVRLQGDRDTVANMILSDNTQNGILTANGATFDVIRDNLIVGSTVAGITLGNDVHDDLLKRNDITKSGGPGILLNLSTHDIRIKHNVIWDNAGDGIEFNASSGSSPRDNIIASNRIADNDAHGIFMEFAIRTLIENNTVNANGADGVHLQSLSNLSRIRFNNFSSNDGNGISVTGPGDNKVVSNRANENGANGIISDTTAVTINSNRANGNGFLNGSGTGGLGISAPALTPGSGNIAKDNDGAAQCVPSSLCA